MKLLYEALRRIPKKFIQDDTQHCTFGDEKVILSNPNFPPMIYTKFFPKWKVLKFQPGSFIQLPERPKCVK